MIDDINFKTSTKLLEFLEKYHEELIAARSTIAGIPEAQYRMLFHLQNSPPMPMSSLGNSLFFTKAYMTKLVDSLAKDGFVERHPDPIDRRVINIHITDAGLKKIQDANSLMLACVMEKLSQISPKDMIDLHSSVEKLLELFNKYNKLHF